MALIWVLSSMRLAHISVDNFPMRDKGVHFMEFAVLATLVGIASYKTWGYRVRSLRLYAFAWFVATSWGVLDEIHQAYVPGRQSDVWDAIADALGASVGAALGVLLWPRLMARFRGRHGDANPSRVEEGHASGQPSTSRDD